MNEKELKELIEGSKILAKCRGGKKGPVEDEKPCINFAFATIVTIKDIKKGKKFTKNNIWVKRPGTGEIKAEFYNNILGKKSNKELLAGIHLSFKDIL